jgi:hypothetical protein
MQELAQLIGYMFILLAAATLAGWLLTTFKSGSRMSVNPEEGTCIRMRGESGMYRTRLVEVRGPFWVLSAPLMRDFYVPIRVGEKITIEVPFPDGVIYSKAVVRSRDAQSHTLIIERPEGARKVERRTERRICDAFNVTVGLEGVTSQLLNISRGGARVSTVHAVTPGERVRLDVAGVDSPIYGSVLECVPVGPQSKVEARIRFETELTSLPSA